MDAVGAAVPDQKSALERSRPCSSVRWRKLFCIEESSFYDRFNSGFAIMLESAADHARKDLVGVGRSLRGPLEGFRDVILTDSTVIRLHDFPAGDTDDRDHGERRVNFLAIRGTSLYVAKKF